MYLRTKLVDSKGEITLIVGNIVGIESNEDQTSTIFMLNGVTYKVIDTQRKLRTQIRRAAEMANATPTEEGTPEENPAPA